MSTRMKVPDLIRENIKNLVDHDEAVQVTERRGATASILDIDVDPRDVGKVIGRAGRVIGALRELASDMGGREGWRYQLEIVGDSKRQRREVDPPTDNLLVGSHSAPQRLFPR